MGVTGNIYVPFRSSDGTATAAPIKKHVRHVIATQPDEKKNKYVIWSVFENNFFYVTHCISKFDRATLFRHVSDHVFVFLRSMIEAAIFWTNSMMQQAFLPDFPHGRSPPTSAIIPETLGVVSNRTT